MSYETARLIHFGILAAGILFWLFALRAHRRAFGAPPDPREPDVLRSGEEELPVHPDEARDRLVAALRGGGLSGTGSVRLEEAAGRRIRGSAAPLLARRAPRPVTFEIDLAAGGAGTRARWTLRGTPSTGLRLASRIFVYFLAPGVMAASCWFMLKFIIPSPDLAARAQVAQTAQIVHFLWPPFLFAHVSRRLADAVATALANLVRNAGF